MRAEPHVAMRRELKRASVREEGMEMARPHTPHVRERLRVGYLVREIQCNHLTFNHTEIVHVAALETGPIRKRPNNSK